MGFCRCNYTFKIGTHQGKDVIWVLFSYSAKLKNDLKAMFPSTKWSRTKKCWYLTDNKAARNKLGAKPKLYYGKNLLERIHLVNRSAFLKLIEQIQLKGYSANTLKTYSVEFAQLLYFLKDKQVDELTPEWLRSYLLYCIREKKISENLIHSRLNAIKFYFEQVLHRENYFIEIPRPKKKLALPKVLSKEEVIRLFKQTSNIKHTLLLKLCYGMGLRVSEIVNLRICHIDSNRMQVRIEASKGKKDRYVPLPKTILDDLRTYYRQFKPKDFLFEGQHGGKYSIRSVQAVFKNAMKKAGINKEIGIHGLRHSYATHLLEYGTDMYLIQKLLGHNNIKTTEIYAKVKSPQLMKVKSPLDNL